MKPARVSSWTDFGVLRTRIFFVFAGSMTPMKPARTARTYFMVLGVTELRQKDDHLG